MSKLGPSLLLPALLMVAPLGAQASAPGSAEIQIGEVMSLRVTSGDGVGASAGEAAELSGISLQVLSNRPWRLLVVAGTGDSLVAQVPGPDVPAVVVARGLPGRATVVVDPAWLYPSTHGLAGSEGIQFALAPD